MSRSVWLKIACSHVVLSFTNAVFDPLNWLCPIHIQNRLFLRDLWALGLKWDQDFHKEEQLDETQKNNRSRYEKEFASKLKKMFIKEPSASLHHKIQWCRNRISVNRAPSI